MGRDAQDEFFALLRHLEGWYADSVRARSYEAGGGSPPAEHAVLLPNRYPGPNWRQRWRCSAGDAEARAAIIDALKDEVYGLTHGPSQSSPASGLHRGTQEWRTAVAMADGSLRAVARRFGISHTEVRRLRLQHAT